MSVKELRPKLDPETCSICERRLLQGERVNWYISPDSARRVVCELCVPRAERVRWVREREGEEVVQLGPAHQQRPGVLGRMMRFFGAAEVDPDEELAAETGTTGEIPLRRPRGSARVARAREQQAPQQHELEARQRDVTAVPTEPGARLERGLEMFNRSQFPRTIAGLTRSLGNPQVAVVNVADSPAVDVWVGWDLAWYQYRIELSDTTEPVEISGRGNDVDELAGVVTSWNAGADGFGRLFLTEPSAAAGQAAASDRADDHNRA